MKTILYAMTVGSFGLFALLPTVAAEETSPAPPTPELKTDRDAAVCDTLWEMEQHIYEGRSRGDGSYYLSVTSPAYLGWPPQFREPADYETLRAGILRGGMAAGEHIDLTLRGCSVDDDVAVIFYSTHRTRAAGGAPADDRFETIHIYRERDGKWLMIGAMARPEPERP
ncbi:MAG: hypothetical protein JJU27_08840 [Gammaproteobacteria bacterium]|nr:hypothetical protein [Gammaproteobacteria bacterium]